MIDTSKYEETNWDLRGQFTHTEMADEVLLLLAEVKRLREVAYNKDIQVGESDREVKRLREGILNVMAGIYDNMYDMNQALDRVIQND